jgi:4-aminobutyrate aminotransferase-like enzyme
VARRAVESAVRRLAERGHRPAALYIDSLFTADGILVPTAEIVATLAEATRAAGALVVADEVQSGHCRTGDMWGFQAWGFTPDVVTLGKPMGNGHPVAAVVTRQELAERFARTTTWFSTFGGNPVACAAALAVLDVLEDERLAERARFVGDELRSGIRGLAQRHPSIGDVRGRGLMAGVELVVDRGSSEPDAGLAGRVKEAMRERGVLIGTTGRAGNVLKIRPPLCITRDEVSIIVEAVDEVLRAVG